MDTSLLLGLSPRVAATHRGQIAQIANAFLKRVTQAARANNLLLLVPLLVMEECYFKLIQIQYEARFGVGRPQWHDIGYKQNPQLIGTFMPMLEQFRTDVLSMPAVITGPDDLIETSAPPPITLERLMLNNCRDHSLLPKDAYILAEASRLGIDSLATMDSDWDRADGFTVYRPN